MATSHPRVRWSLCACALIAAAWTIAMARPGAAAGLGARGPIAQGPADAAPSAGPATDPQGLAAAAAAPAAGAPAMPPGAGHPLIVLLTDYGSKDFYVGALKGVIYKIAPGATIDEITHDVADFDIQEGAYTLLQASREFPAGTIFLAMVDPGVGTPVKPIIVWTRNGLYFLAPDNGLLTLVADEFGIAQIQEISNPRMMRPGAVSRTFTARDLFAPAAAHLAAGSPLKDFGPALPSITRLPVTPLTIGRNVITGCVLMADHYGNLITNVTEAALARGGVKAGKHLSITLGDRKMEMPLVRTYADVPQGKPLALVASSGDLELAVNLGSMAGLTGAGRNTPLKLEW